MQAMTIGWREWVALPDLGLPLIKAKIDTGAKTSALHAFEVERFKQNHQDYVRFAMHPLQKRHDIVVSCQAPLLDQRQVSDSGGHRELRYVIETRFVLNQQEWPIEITLTDRDSMLFRMLLGRQAMPSCISVSPSQSFLYGRHNNAIEYYT